MKRMFFIFIILILLIATVLISQESQQKINEDKILRDVPFNKIVLTTLIAIERNYQVKQRLFPLVHGDDYYMVVLRTARRIILEESMKKTSNPVAATVDTTKGSANVKKQN